MRPVPSHLLGSELGFVLRLPRVADFSGQHSCRFSANSSSLRSLLAALRLQMAQTDTTNRKRRSGCSCADYVENTTVVGAFRIVHALSSGAAHGSHTKKGNIFCAEAL